MESLNWKKKYSVGVFEIDAEHKIFLKTIKKINSAFENQVSPDIQQRLLEELYKYADFHFHSEENVMLMCEYPDYENHVQQHNELMQTLADTINFLDIRKIDKIKLINFLVLWFREHTVLTDLKLGQFLQEKSNGHHLTDFDW